MMQHALQFNNDFLDTYMEMIEETESPRIYHVWSALAGIAACAGRKISMPWGSGKLFPNLYILLVGSPAARKSTAMEITQDILIESTNIRFAQDDCGGKRQGLIGLMIGEEFDEDELDIKKQLDNLILTPESLGEIEVDLSTKRPSQPADDKHVVMVASTEFNNFIGHGNIEFLEFLARMYDGKPYTYQLKNRKEKMVMGAPLITLIGCTTPVNIATAMPKEAIGAGFMSRTILVHGGPTHKDLESLPPLPRNLMDEIGKRFAEIYYSGGGVITRTPECLRYCESIYKKNPHIVDGRFLHYIARRHTHFLKVAMVFAIARGSNVISLEDAQNADVLLKTTEKTMPDALGEYGLNPISAAKQKIIDFIAYAQEPVTVSMLHQFMHRDLRMQELATCINDLCIAGKIQRINSAIYGQAAYIPKVDVAPELLTMMDRMQTAPTTEIKQ